MKKRERKILMCSISSKSESLLCAILSFYYGDCNTGACGSNVKEMCKHILEIFQCDVHRMRRGFFPEEVSSTKCSL